MANRIALLVFAPVALAGLAAVATSASAAPDADECRAGPKGQPPAGKHWYYRTNRATQRKCWYLGDEGARIAAAVPGKQPASPKPEEAARRIDAPSPAENARAELIDEPAAEPASAPTAQIEPEPSHDVPDVAHSRHWTVASRWPDPVNAFSPDHATIGVPAPVSQAREPVPFRVAAAVEPAVAADPAGVNLAQVVVALIVAVVFGGIAIIALASGWLNRRQSSSQFRVAPRAMPRDEMAAFAAAAAREHATLVRAPSQRNLSDEIEHMEQLLTIARKDRANH